MSRSRPAAHCSCTRFVRTEVFSIERDPRRSIPKRKLLVPPLLPAAVLFVGYVAEIAGHPWNVHGDLILLLLVVIGMSAVAVIFEIAALVTSFRLIGAGVVKASTLDVICIAYGSLFAAGGAGLLVVFLSRQ
jgi:hypothetical protein